MKEDNVIKKSILSILVFIIFVIIAFYFIFKDTSLKEVVENFTNSNKLYIILAIFCMFLYNVFEALNLKVILSFLKNKVKLRNCYKYAIGAFFAASITPSSSGGDPMAFYLMSKDKIHVSHAVITLLIKLLIYQLVVIILSVLSFIISYREIVPVLGNMKYLTYLGITLNCLVFCLYFLLIFQKKIIVFFIELFCKLLNKLHYKKTAILKIKINNQLDEYSNAIAILKNNKIMFLKIIFITLIQMLFYFSIPYLVYLALGYNENSLFHFISIQAILYATVSSLPFPGAVGISETVFMKLYQKLFNLAILGSAMFITRFINFYLFVIYTGTLLLFFITKDYIAKNRKRKN